MTKKIIPPDPRGGHVRLYWEILDSNAWRCLSATDQRAYVALQRQLRSTNNGDLSLPLTYARHAGITSSATLAKSLRALVAVGLLAVTRRGGCTKGGQRLPNLYRFTDHQVYEHPVKNIEATKPTNEWKAVKSIAMGRALIRDAEKLAAEISASKKNTLLQKFNLTASKNELVERLTASKNEVWPALPTSIIEAGKTTKTGQKTKQNNDFQKSASVLESKNHTSKIEALSTVAIPSGEFGSSEVLSTGSPVSRLPAARTLFGRILHRARPTTKPTGYHAARAKFSTITGGLGHG